MPSFAVICPLISSQPLRWGRSCLPTPLRGGKYVKSKYYMIIRMPYDGKNGLMEVNRSIFCWRKRRSIIMDTRIYQYTSAITEKIQIAIRYTKPTQNIRQTDCLTLSQQAAEIYLFVRSPRPRKIFQYCNGRIECQAQWLLPKWRV